MFVSEKGEVYACGWGADGQTGLGHFNFEWQSSRVLGDIEGENIVKVSSAADCVLAINGECALCLF
jgi:alpha-tubulin suppressor-like RCC1 family protein